MSAAARKSSRGDLCNELVAMELRPWGEYKRRRKAITQWQLARLLKTFTTGTVPMRTNDGSVLHGYRCKDFQEAFDAYFPLKIRNPKATTTLPSRATTQTTIFDLRSLRKARTAVLTTLRMRRRTGNPALPSTAPDLTTVPRRRHLTITSTTRAIGLTPTVRKSSDTPTRRRRSTICQWS